VARVSDGKYFNKDTREFDRYTTDNYTSFVFTLYNHHIPGLTVSEVEYIPVGQQDLIFEYVDSIGTVLKRERHVFGGSRDKNAPKACVIFGTIYDTSGSPIRNATVKVSLNKAGYFIDKNPIVGPELSTVSDESGYFELAVIQGVNVTITIPAIGFVTSGYVPLISVVELSPYSLLRERV
jgi:uncharacterized secreted protein with C-terminal beta-propeller domain